MGPYATMILGDFGADVIKVEPPEGDVMRYAWPFRHPGMGSIYLNVNRNKRSIVLDLKKDAAREPRPRAALGCARVQHPPAGHGSPEAVLRRGEKVNPRIIYAGCFGYSQRGPYAAKAAYDDLIQGAAGLPWLLQKQGASEPRYAG